MRYLTIIATILLCASTAWGGFGYGRVVGGTPLSTVTKLTKSDNFNRADQDPLRDGVDTSSTPTGTWAPSYLGLMKIVSNQATRSGAITGVFWNADTFSANQSSQVYVVSNNNAYSGPGVRMSNGTTDTLHGYFASVQFGTVGLYRYNNGSRTNLNTSLATGVTVASKTFKLTATGTSPTILRVYVDGVQVGSDYSDSSPITSGQPGMISDGATFDNWVGAEL